MSVRVEALAPVVAAAFAGLLLVAAPAAADETCLRLAWVEGDVAGFSSILSPDRSRQVGYIDYRQVRDGKALEVRRIARFDDGSSDEDRIEAEVGETLRTVRGRMIIRNAAGVATLDLSIDVGEGRIRGFSGLGEERDEYDEAVEISPCTYWGPLLGIVLKNFEKNAVDDQLVVASVVATPKPRLLHFEFTRQEKVAILRAGGKIEAERFSMVPKVNFLLDPFLKFLGPDTSFFQQAGRPPSMAAFAGPRNFEGQTIRIE